MRNFSIETLLLWTYNRLIPSLLAVSALIGLWFLGQAVERPVYDLLTRWSAKPAQQSPVTLVLIDDASVLRLSGRFGPMPWPRKAFLEIFNAIYARKPALVVFDSHFINLNQPGDRQFFERLAQFPNLISGLALSENQNAPNDLNSQFPEYYRLKLGVVSMQEDADGIIRRFQPFYALSLPTGGRKTYPALSMAAVTTFQHRSSTQPNQTLLLRWHRILNPGKAEYARSHEAIPLWRFFEPSTPKPELSGRIALIGSASTFYRDYHQSPMALRHSGPDIHATAIDNLLHGKSIRKLPAWLNLLLLCLLCYLTFHLRMNIRHFGKTLLYTLGMVVIYFWIALWLLAEQSWWIDVATPSLFMAAAFLAGSTFRIFFKEKQLAAMEKSLSQLVDPEVFQEIRRLSHVLKPGGEKLEITSMFVDIRNFTTLAERLQPHEVTEILNEFYGAIVGIVFSYQGTIDKFMGDGILIIFGAPLPNQNHRVLAMRATLDILEATARLSTRWRENRAIETDIGISLNSGMAFVGFLGPTDKLEYTGVGDTVNICVRLQEHTKQFHTRLILSEHTLQGVQEFLSDKITPENIIPLGEAALRGREATVRIFTLQQALLQA